MNQPRMKGSRARAAAAVFPSLIALTLAGLGAGSCSKQGPFPPPDPESAQVTLSFAEAPAGVECVAVTVATDRAERRLFPVTPGKPAVFPLVLKPGPTVFAVDAYDDDCPQLGKAPTASWSGGPVSVTLQRGPNPAIVIILTRNSDVTVVLGFDPGQPGGPGFCSAGGSACTKSAECCSKMCSIDPEMPNSVGICRADEPPVDAGDLVNYNPDELRRVGARAIFPNFDGDSFFVSFPRAACDAQHPDREASDIRARYVTPALRGTGFTNFDSLATPPPEPVRLPPGDLRNQIATTCDRSSDFGKGDPLCEFLRSIDARGGTPVPPPPAYRFFEQTMGMSPALFKAEMERGINYWMFAQRVRNVPIEHKAAIAIQRGSDRRVSAVFGSVLSRFVVVNDIGINAPTALVEAQKSLARLEGVIATQLRGREPPVLVALPYGSVPRNPQTGARGGTALRFAWRMPIVAARSISFRLGTDTINAAAAINTQLTSYTIWADATTGALLKYVADAHDDMSLPFAPAYCRDPSQPGGGQCGVTLNLVSTTGTVDLSAQPGFAIGLPAPFTYPGVDPTEFTATFPPDEGANFCQADPLYRGLNAFAVLEQARRTMEYGGSLLLPTPALKVMVDQPGLDNTANFGLSTLSFIKGSTGANTCDPTSPASASKLSGAQDATIIAHEYAHIMTAHLQTSNPSGECGPGGCPVLNPYNRSFFHDYADGLSAILTETPCIGGWSLRSASTLAPTSLLAEHVTSACGNAKETSKLPRLLYADDEPASPFISAGFGTGSGLRQDRFPSHRWAAKGEYSDGQIVGAAFWHLWQGMNSHARALGTIPVWGFVNQAVRSSGFTPIIGAYADFSYDINIYRSGQELLTHLSDQWVTGGVSHTLNKLHSAFARAGFFLTPSSCLTGALMDTTAPLDPHLCPEGRNGADAIVDIDDGDKSPLDSLARNDIRLADDDFVVADKSKPPTFRVWTGVPFAFAPVDDPNIPGQVIPEQLMCNDQFVVEVRVSGTASWTAVTPPPMHPGVSLVPRTKRNAIVPNPCYATIPIDLPLWDTLVTAAGPAPATFAKIEYRVRTWRGSAMATPRSSTEPGNGTWSTPPNAPVEPSSFFITADGRAPL